LKGVNAVPNEEIREQNFNHVMKTTYNLYLNYGISNVTKQMIAKESGLSTKTISRYFIGKTDCTIRVAEWVLQQIRLEIGKDFPESYFTDGKHTGAQLFEQYMFALKDLFFSEPRTFVLYSEFKLYIYHNCDDYEQNYTLLCNCMGSRHLRRQIYMLGKTDGTLPSDINVTAEEEYFCESFFGFLANLALSYGAHSKEEMANQIDQRIKNTIALYSQPLLGKTK
jgi:AcrR family transcriptional regulator